MQRARALTAAADLSSWMGETDGYLRRAQEAIADLPRDG